MLPIRKPLPGVLLWPSLAAPPARPVEIWQVLGLL